MVVCGSCGRSSEDGSLICRGCGSRLTGETTEALPASDLTARAPASPLRAGDVLGGFVIEDVAGRGGMGTVYRARDPRLGRPVALKVLTGAHVNDAAFRKRFEREWRLTAALDHPHIVGVYGAGDDHGRLYLAMQFIEGTGLDDVLERHDRLDALDAASIVLQVGQALDAAHAHGLVHRDVKPANILVAEGPRGGHAFLADFGVTVERDAATRLTRPGGFVGTPAYAAPEQIRGGPVDGRTDVYALGGVLYHSLTGSEPFPAGSHEAVIDAHLRDPPPRPSRVVTDLPGAFDRVVERAMAKAPRDRYRSAGDLGRAAVAAATGSRPPRERRGVATELAAPQRTPRVHRHRRVVVLAAAVAVLLTVVLLGRSRDPAPAPIDPAGAAAGAAIRLPERPDRIAVAGRFVWTLTAEDGDLVRTDPKERVTRSLPPSVALSGGRFPGLAAGDGALWITQAYEAIGGVTKADATTGEALARVRIPRAFAIAAGAGGAWATTTSPQPGRPGTLVRLSGDGTRRLAGPVPAGREPVAVAIGAGSIWVADRSGDAVLRFDPRTLRRTATVRVGDGPAALAAADTVVWVANLDERTLMRIDVASGNPEGAPVTLGKEIDDIAISNGGAWVATADGTVSRLAASDGATIGDPIRVGRPPLALAAADDGVWVASATERTVQLLRVPG